MVFLFSFLYCQAQTTEFYIEETEFKFFAHPYYLRYDMSLPFTQIKQKDEEEEDPLARLMAWQARKGTMKTEN